MNIDRMNSDKMNSDKMNIDTMNSDMENLSRNIRYLRMQKGWNQDDLAAEIHIARSTYSTYETGAKIPDLQTLDALAAIYDIGFEGLVSYDLTDSLMSRIYFDPSDKELMTLFSDFRELSIASKNIVAENLSILLERESVFYQSYSRKKEPLQEQLRNEVDGDGNGEDGGNGTEE